ncbi:MAG: ABC transporter substrate-binding protein [Thermofilaceae archaeon]
MPGARKPLLIGVIAAVVIVALAAAALFFFQQPQQPAPTPGPAEEAAAPAKPQEIEVLRISQRADLSTIDVQVATDSPTLNVFGHVYETLFKLRFTPDGTPVFEPHLVESYEFVNETAIKFKLRSGIRFHDGKPLTAKDVVATFKRGPVVGSLPRVLLGPVKSVEAIDDLTFVIVLKYPFAPIIAHLAHPSTAIIPAWVAELFPDKPINSTAYIIGTGPFKFVEFRKLERTVLERFEDYWGPRPTVKRLEWVPVEDDDTRAAKLEAGDVSVITHVPPHLARLLRDRGFKVVQMPSTRVIYIGISVDRITDPRVRQALNLAVDKNAIVSRILDGAGTVATAPIPPAVFGYSPQTPYGYDPDRARRLLEEAGWAGRELVMIAPSGRYLKDREIAEAIQMYLQAVGLNVKLTTMEWAAYIAKVMGEVRDFDLFLLGWSTATLDADYGLYSLFHSKAPFNRMRYSNPKVDELLEAARAEANFEKRKQLYGQAQELIWQDAPWIFLHVEDLIVAMDPNLENVEVQPIERWILTYATRR